LKRFLSIIAWLGAALILAASIPLLPLLLSNDRGFQDPISLLSSGGFFVYFEISILGVLLALIGGFKANPRYFWLGIIIAGCVSILASTGVCLDDHFARLYTDFRPEYIILFIPGLVLIIQGVLLKLVRW
jgi:hypothetical protein